MSESTITTPAEAETSAVRKQPARPAAQPSASGTRPKFSPVGDYGLPCDCNSAALVDRAGSIDWLCLPRYDSAAIFSPRAWERRMGPDPARRPRRVAELALLYREQLGELHPEIQAFVDEELVVREDMGIDEYTDTHHDFAMVPHTLILSPGLRVEKVYVGYWSWGRPSPEQLWADLAELFARIEPDFDPTAPKARAAWEKQLAGAPA